MSVSADHAPAAPGFGAGPRPAIVVGVDGMAAGDAALSWALDEAARRGDPLTVVSVWPYPVMAGDGMFVPVMGDADSPTSTSQDIDDALARVGYHNQVAVTRRPRFGIPAQVLKEDAGPGTELMVLGRSARGRAHDLFTGSVAHTICQFGNCPVVVVPVPDPPVAATTGGGVITVGLDGSPRSRFGLQWALREALVRLVQVHAVLVWDSVPRPPQEGTLVVVADSEPTAGAQAEALLTTEIDAARRAVPEAAAVAVSADAICGSARAVLLGEAARGDLLVLGDHPRSVLSQMLLGSITDTCLRHAAVPVVVVPAPEA